MTESNRQKKIFKKALNVLDPSNVNQWWKDREDIKWVILEYLKLVNFYFWEQFLLD